MSYPDVFLAFRCAKDCRQAVLCDAPRRIAKPNSLMIIYRYLTALHGIEALQTGKWKVGRFGELNDPLDCEPIVKNSEPLLTGLLSQTNAYEQFSESIGLLCYSKIIDEPVMWSHYADKHQGIALGFEFPDNGTRENAPAVQVKYSWDRAQLPREELNYSIPEGVDNYVTRIMKSGFTIKAKTWEYECEYRQFIHFNNCSLRSLHYFGDVPFSSLKRIVLGARCKIANADIWRSVQGKPNCEAVNAKAWCGRLKTVPTGYRLEFVQPPPAGASS
jgi:hypothetical protein